MGKPVTQARQPLARIKISPTNYKVWSQLAAKVIAQLTLNVSEFPTPFPTVVQLGTDLTALNAAIAALGTKNNKGGKAEVLAVRAACNTLANDLRLELAYVLNTINKALPPDQQQVLLNQSGFTQANIISKIPTTQFVKFAKQSNTRQFPQALRRISFKKPLGLIKGGQIAAYNVYDAATGNFLFMSTKTNFQMTGGALGAISSVKVIPFNNRGNGNSFTIAVV